MDSKKFAKLAISHFTDVGYYSEIEPDKLEQIFEDYLEIVYSRKIELLTIQVNIDKANDEHWTVGRYEREMKILGEEMSTIVNDLLVYKKKEYNKIESNG